MSNINKYLVSLVCSFLALGIYHHAIGQDAYEIIKEMNNRQRGIISSQGEMKSIIEELLQTSQE